MRVLLEHGAGKSVGRITRKRNELDEALYKVIEMGHVDTARLLIDNGAKVHLSLYRAIHSRKNQIEMMQMLLEKGANIDEQDSLRGDTPLMTAAIMGKEDIVSFLIESGADTNIRDKSGNNVLLNFIRHNGGDEHYLKSKFEQFIPFLIRKGIDVNIRNSITGATALSSTRSTKIIKILIENGANIEAKDFEGNTPLAVASKLAWDYENKIKYLKGANVNAVDNKGMTILKIIDQEIEKKKNDKERQKNYPGELEGYLKHYNEIIKILKAAGAKD